MLVDDITITIKAGKGGDGAVSFRRTGQTPKGGPDGGNGGTGGNVYFQGIDDIEALRQFRFKKDLKAEDGVPGGRQNLYGRKGEDLILRIPVGTRITDLTKNNSIEIDDTETKVLIAKGGQGGRGNNEFKSATNQTPRYAEKGEPGEIKKLHLQLRLIAQVGLIGLPNAGKSSLLATLTNAQPKIGNYAFTTLEPNLGVMDGITLADIPGLIEGASTGKGLGIQFLKHIEKTKLLIHCIDATVDNIRQTYDVVRKEFEQYNKTLLQKEEIIVLTKSDLLDDKTLRGKIKQLSKTKKPIYTVSVYNPESLSQLKGTILAAIK